MVNPTDKMQKNYEFLLKVYEKFLEKLKPGKRLSSVYEDILVYVTSERKDLVSLKDVYVNVSNFERSYWWELISLKRVYS